jgi:hypothetical protein
MLEIVFNEPQDICVKEKHVKNNSSVLYCTIDKELKSTVSWDFYYIC